MRNITELLNKIAGSNYDLGNNIKGISYDSRRTKEGDIFIALTGNNYDGNSYIEEAIESGAIAVITSERIEDKKLQVPIINVDNTRKFMSKISSEINDCPSKNINMIGITGTNGKSTIAKIIEHILNDNNISAGSLGTLGFSSPSGVISTGFTTPESVELHSMLKMLVEAKTKFCIMEVSSHSLDMHRVDDVNYNTVIFSNLTQDHLDYHSSMDRYFHTKQKLFKMVDKDSLAVINCDDYYGKKIIKSCSANIIKYGFDKEANIRILDANYNLFGTTAEIQIDSSKYKIRTNLIGEFNLYNIAASIASLIGILDIDTIVKSLINIQDIPGRMNTIFTNNKKIIIDYAHTPDAFNNIINTTRSIMDDIGKIIVVFGCGGNRDSYKRKEIGSIVDTLSDYSIITDDNPRNEDPDNIINEILLGYDTKNYKIIRNRQDGIIAGINKLNNNDILLVLGKGNEDYQEVNNTRVYHSDFDTVNNYIYEI